MPAHFTNPDACDKIKGMKKFVNVRLPVIIALCICAGVAIAAILYRHNLTAFLLLLGLPVAFAIFALCFLIDKKHKKTARILIFVILPLIFFTAAGFETYYRLKSYDTAETEPMTSYRIDGKVTEKGKTANGEYIIIGDIKADGKKIGGKAFVYLAPTYGEVCDVGYEVTFNAGLEKYNAYEYGEITSFAEDGIKYGAAVYSGLTSTYKFSLLGAVRTRIYNTLFDNLDEETASVAYAMLTGNTQNIQSSTLESFRYGGVAHIFAISGLHIGILYATISFILKKLRLNKYAAAAVSVFAILFYSAVCGFTLSSVRAVIMCAVLSLYKLALRKYDSLNSLAFAVTLILLINPLHFYSVGFRLSVCAVGGIAVFSKHISRELRRLKIPNPPREAISVSLGAQLGTMPIMLVSFGYISGSGLLLNIVVIPLFSVVYTLLFYSTMICALVPAAGVIMQYTVLPLQALMSFFIGFGLEKALISGVGANFWTPFYFVAALFISDKINLNFTKRTAAFAAVTVLAALVAVFKFFTPFSGYRVVISSSGYGGAVLIKSPKGSALIATDEISASAVDTLLDEQFLSGVDALIILGDGSAQFLDGNVNYGAAYISDQLPAIQLLPGEYISYSSSFTVCGAEFGYIDANNLIVKVDGVVFGISVADNVIEECDIFISDENNLFTKCGTEISFNSGYGNFSVLQCGNITYGIDRGLYRLMTEIPPKP